MLLYMLWYSLVWERCWKALVVISGYESEIPWLPNYDDLQYDLSGTVQITFIFIDFRVCDFAFAFKTQNAPCVSRFKRVLFSDRFQFAF